MSPWAAVLAVSALACGAPEPGDVVPPVAPVEARAPAEPLPPPPPPPTPLEAIEAGLAEALARHRDLAARVAVPPLSGRPLPIKPGEPFPDAGALGAFLEALGDLASSDTPVAVEPVYDDALVEAVRRFQVRHGLEADGVIGRQTHAALVVPLADRVWQIERALERLRELPAAGEGPLLLVNVPMFHAWGWDAAAAARPAFDTAVIVGRARVTETPLFTAEMTRVTFRPYWNVPVSILRGEILPRLEEDPEYLARERLEIVEGQTDNAAVIELSDASLEGLARGTYRLRQRPGAHNSLGLVRFTFPNPHDVYMHDTSARGLFTRVRRDLSHGCVRVANPEGLAAWVLGGHSEWTADRIRVAMREGANSQSVPLVRPVRVVFTYLTAMPWPGEGTVRFAADIYGLDRRDDPRR